MTTMQHVERYIVLKQHLGFRYDKESKILRAYARKADELAQDFLRADAMVEWAAQAVTIYAARTRLATLRNFSEWLRSEDARHEIPPKGILGYGRKKRPTPHLLTAEEIRLVMDAAMTLPPAGSITPHAIHCMIGLVAATGLRAREAASLRLSDITPDGLVIRESKFRKTRLVALHPSVRNALQRYVGLRTQMGGSEDHLFVLSTGRQISSKYFSDRFSELARGVGLKECNGRVGPTVHSLRHSFAVRSLEAATATDPDKISRHMTALSTYLGHGHIACTYWYLEATPALLQSIADATENAHKRRAER